MDIRTFDNRHPGHTTLWQHLRRTHTRYLLVLLYVLTHAIGLALLVAAEPLQVRAEPIILDPLLPDQRRFGELVFLRGYELVSRDRRFGGLSGLTLDPTGTHLYAVSDRGYGLSARLSHDATGVLTALEAWEITPLRTPLGDIVNRSQRDAEAIVRNSDGSFVIAFEHIHRLWHYTNFGALPEVLPMPTALVHAPVNGGVEAATRLPDGRLLLLTERFKNTDGTYKGWLSTPDGYVPLAYFADAGYNPTDVAALANGDILVLERRYRFPLGVAARLRHIPQAYVQPGALLRGRTLVELKQPLTIDNFEGLAVHEDGQGSVILYMVSDDNYLAFQQTLLLQFRWTPGTSR